MRCERQVEPRKWRYAKERETEGKGVYQESQIKYKYTISGMRKKRRKIACRSAIQIDDLVEAGAVIYRCNEPDVLQLRPS